MKLEPVIPFEPIAASNPPDAGGNWIAQIKWDGVRMLTYRDGSEVRLVNRRLNDKTSQYPELTDPSTYCRAASFILDGEIIALDEGRPAFHQIMKRDRLRLKTQIQAARSRVPISYMVFDLLYCEGEWLLNKPLAERQQLLSSIILPQPTVQVVPNVTDAQGLLEVMRQHGMEGIVCKDLSSTYVLDGKDRRWQKVKLFQDLYAAVGGVTYRDKLVNSLLLGLFNAQGEFVYIGHAGTGKLRKSEWRELTERVPPLKSSHMPFVNQPERYKDAVWLKPTLTVRVQFMEWTPGFTMRHPSIQGFADMPMSACSWSQIPTTGEER